MLILESPQQFLAEQDAFVDRVKQLVAKGWTIHQLGPEIGLYFGTVEKYIYGTAWPSIATILSCDPKVQQLLAKPPPTNKRRGRPNHLRLRK